MSFIKPKFVCSLPMVTFLSLVTLFILNLPQTQGQDICATNGAFKEGAESHVTVRRSTRRGAKNKAEILWDPTAMLTDPTRYKVAAAELEMRQDDQSDWNIAEVDTKNHNRYIKWSVKVKPCKKYHFRIKVTGNDVESMEACLPINSVLDSLSEEDIKKSGYTPEPVRGFEADVHAEHAELKWDPSDCAESYEVGYIAAGDEGDATTVKPVGLLTSVSVSNLQPCTRYETFVYASFCDRYSEISTEFATEPRLDAANTLEVETNAGLNSVQVSWPTWKAVSCIDKYTVKACVAGTEECTADEEVQKAVGSPFVSQKVTGLQPCTEYTLHIQPLFKDLNIEAKVISFHTDSMDADQVNVGTVGSEFRDGSIFISWAEVKCATKYKVYQREIGVDEWMEVDETGDTAMTVRELTTCTRYQFAITAVLVDAEDRETETEKELGPETVTELDETTHFRAPRFSAQAGDNTLDIVWGHADCIESYMVKVCPKEGLYTDCPSEPVVPEDNGNKEISHTISGLESCTEYDVHIIPVLQGKEFTAHPETVRTTNGIPEAPQFDVVLKDGSSEASITWTPVNCASAYKIYYKVEEDGPESEDVEVALNSEKEKTFAENRPCQTYSYAVTTMVNEEESERPENDWKNIVMPPKTDLQPTLKMVTHDEGKVTLKIDLADENKQCGIDQYEVVYSKETSCCGDDCATETKVFKPEELNNGDIVVNVTGDVTGKIFKARVLYKDHAEWSRQAEFGEKAEQRCGGGGASELPLIPIVVGVAVLALVVIVVTVLLVKRSRNRNFDPEKAENGNGPNKNHHQNLVNSDEEETQKLNEAHA